MHPQLPFTRDLVLIGGGHSHALVLRKWGMNPLPGARVTVINPGPTGPYSGMLPGFLAGHYTRDELNIDLVKLARFAGARLIDGRATHIDREAKTIHVAGRPPIRYDVASLDIGITSTLSDMPGFDEFAVPAKPLGAFASAWSRFRNTPGPASVAVIGGGIAGVEIILSFAHALKSDGREAKLTLIDNATALSALPDKSRSRLQEELTRWGIETRENCSISHIRQDQIVLTSGEIIDARFICGAAGAVPQNWLAQTGLDLEQGFVKIGPTLTSSDPAIFAAGDCAHMITSPRPKAGVFAVRQAPILFHNLRVALEECGTLRPYRPQKDYLKLVSLGRKSALADRFGVTLAGPLLWRWKNRIDQTFMEKFRTLPQMRQPAIPRHVAADTKAVLGDKPMCGGCGSKVGQSVLHRALPQLGSLRDDITALPDDDAALLHTGGAKQVISTDHLRAMIADPVTMTKIAAQHALNDIWAMGAAPQAATATVILPRMSPELAQGTLDEIMATARDCFEEAGAEIVGGHSSFGSEMTLGFTVTGLCQTVPITLSGARPGDSLILTKPLGSGLMMAAEMAGHAKGEWVMSALAEMAKSQKRPSEILAQAHAMTDVTGFGLIGHLNNLIQQSNTGAHLFLENIPKLAGASELARAGHHSTLLPENRKIRPDLPARPEFDILFDPQTSGGLLAAVAGNAEPLVQQLVHEGHHAALIGTVTETPGQISFA
jgi:selenide,water dikinase